MIYQAKYLGIFDGRRISAGAGYLVIYAASLNESFWISMEEVVCFREASRLKMLNFSSMIMGNFEMGIKSLISSGITDGKNVN